MRTLAISQKVLREIIRDKRTLALTIFAPLFIMWLVSVLFTATTNIDVTVGTVNVDSSITKTLNDIDHVSVNEYSNNSAAHKALEDGKLDTTISYNKDKNTYDITYTNYDVSQTALSKQAFNTSLVRTNTEKLRDTLKEVLAQSAQLKAQLQQSTRQSNSQAQSQSQTQTQSQTQSQTTQESASGSTAESESESASAPSISEHYVYGSSDTTYFAKVSPIMMNFVVFFYVFLISGMALLRERSTGTLDRLLATPVRRSEIVWGYIVSYALIALVQTTIIVSASIWLLHIEIAGNVAYIFLINFLLALVALSIGFLLSTLVNTEFEMMQFIPLVVIPQILFSGLIPLDSLPQWAQAIKVIFPMSYSSTAMTDVIIQGKGFDAIAMNLLILFGFWVVLTALNVAGLRRYRKA